MGCAIITAYDERDRSQREHELRHIAVIKELKEEQLKMQTEIYELKSIIQALRSALAVAAPSTSA